MDKVKDILKKYSVELVLVIIIIAFAIARPTTFFTPGNAITVLRQSSILGIISIGMMFVMLSGGLNLAVGAMVSVVNVSSAVFLTTCNMHWAYAYLLAILISTAVGWITGFIIIKTGIWPMIGSLAIQTVLFGVAYIICGGLPIYNIPKDAIFFGQGSIGPIPIPVVIFLVIAVIASFVLNKTYIGRHFYASGSNPEAARLSGININQINILSYTISGFLCGIAGVIMTGRVSSGQPAVGKGMDMTCLTAVVLGGVSLTGGEGKVFKAIMGVLILGVLTNGMTIMNIDEYTQMIVEGTILLLAVCFDGMNAKLSQKSMKKVEEKQNQEKQE